MKFKLSRSQWETIGKTAGWENKNPSIARAASSMEDAKAVAAELGWKIIQTPGHAIEFQRPNTSPYANGGNSFFLTNETPEAIQNAIATMRQESVEQKNRNLAKTLESQVKAVSGEKHKTRDGWYQHTIISFKGKEIGRIQTRLRNDKVDTISCCGDYCVQGSDVKWIIASALNKAIITMDDISATACKKPSNIKKANGWGHISGDLSDILEAQVMMGVREGQNQDQIFLRIKNLDQGLKDMLAEENVTDEDLVEFINDNIRMYNMQRRQ